jgi:hypothetical protein
MRAFPAYLAGRRARARTVVAQASYTPWGDVGKKIRGNALKWAIYRYFSGENARLALESSSR